MHVPNPTGTAEPVELSIDQHIIEPMGFQHAIPPPDSTEFDDNGARLNFTERPDQKNGLLRLALVPNVVGPVQTAVRVGDESISWRMVVVP